MKNIIKKIAFVFVLVGIFSTGASVSFASSAPTITSGTATNITTTSADLNGLVNPNGDNTTAWFETPSDGPFQSQNLGSGSSDVSMLAYNLTGLTPGTLYTFKIVAGNSNGPTDSGFIFSFTTAVAPAPTIVSATTTNITTTSADLNGSINPNGDNTTAWFETPSDGPFQSQNLGSGSSDVSMLAYSLTGLTPSTTYTFRIIAGNTNGGPVTGGWVSFTTATPPILPSPTLVSTTTTNITTTSVDLNGVVNPNGYATTAWFETPSGGPFQNQNLGNGSSDVTLLPYSLTGLTPSTTYTFRIITGNTNGSITGGWISFTTAAIPNGGGGGGGATMTPSVITQNASTTTSNSTKLNGSINPNGYTTTA
ncbi:MAG: fibronectin type III domain-containing protein, partial [Candidatus Moraniibacteriota bacterium]